MQTTAVFPSDLAGAASATPARHHRRPLAAFAGWIGVMLEARRTRRALAEMEPRLLSDIGISRFDALREAARAVGPRPAGATLDRIAGWSERASVQAPA